MNAAINVSIKARGKTTSKLFQLDRFIFAIPTQNNRKKKHQAIKPLSNIDLVLFPNTFAINQKRKTYKADNRVSQIPQIIKMLKFISATLGTIDKN